jgi:ArsR family transcriptional regulator, arsenate/arsenite/antimonite-responsive transcriptional repressor
MLDELVASSVRYRDDERRAMRREYSDSAFLMKALADETRLQIVDQLSRGEFCACELLESLEITQPTLSYHMKILTESGLVQGTKRGSWMHYRLVTERFSQLLAFLRDITLIYR